MGTIAEMYRRVKMLNLPREVQQIIKDTKPDIVLLQQQQLYEGRNADNRPITPFYAAETIRIKTTERNPPQPVDRVTLKDTGAFYSKIKVTNVTKESFEVKSSDKKNGELTDRYGEDIFGMNLPSRILYVNEHFFPKLKQYIEQITGLLMR